jgi:hypothetical protein
MSRLPAAIYLWCRVVQRIRLLVSCAAAAIAAAGSKPDGGASRMLLLSVFAEIVNLNATSN